jgi:choline dehydrogenase-like flavoprotein
MIQRLTEASEATLIQETTFGIDVQGRYVCNTWDEAVGTIGNGGFAFDAVVIGAGMVGAYCAEKIFRESGKARRVLVLDAGSFLVSEHVQNLSNLGLGVGGAARAVVNGQEPSPQGEIANGAPTWGLPWHSNEPFPGLAYCIGGRSLYWGGWSPQLTDADLAKWPVDVVQYLKGAYNDVEKEIGVDPTTDYISGPLFDVLLKAFKAAAGQVPSVDRVGEAPLAIQGAPPAPGLFSFDKYSSAPILITAVREDVGDAGRRRAASLDAGRQLFLVPRAHVVKLYLTGNVVSQIEVDVNGQRRFIGVAPECAVVLAAGTIESTRLALTSFPRPEMGRNLMAHLRSNTTVRIKRALFPKLKTRPDDLEAAALIVKGSTPQGRYHLQVTAADVQGSDPEKNMFHMIPDIDLLQQIVANQDPDWIVLTLRGIGEMLGDMQATPTNPATSWMNLAFDTADQRDEFGMRRAWVNLVTTNAEMALWQVMDDAAIALAKKLAGDDPAKIQYFYKDSFRNDSRDPGSWHAIPPPPSPNNDPFDPANKVRDQLGSTHHEAGTLWMGASVQDSLTGLDGRFHHVANAYVAGPALFPTLGSANPSLTALTLARRTAKAIVAGATTLEEGFRSLFDGTLTGWQMVGSGRFVVVGHDTLESADGIGLLWYTPEQFGDFILRVDWRSSNVFDNSGVFLRFPALGSSDSANDWRLAVEQGYEVQIDARGYNPDTNTTGSPAHSTGAVYTLAPATQQAARTIGEWNRFEIQVAGDSVNVILNTTPVSSLTRNTGRPLKGHIGLQNHHPGSRVQFRNIRIKRLS